MDIATAEQAVRDLADEITAAMHAKGYEKATVEFWIGPRGTRVVWMVSRATSQQKCGWGDDLADAGRQARSYVVELEDAHAYDDELSAPLFLMSEQQQAAE